MDKQIIDKLVKFGLITNICVDPDRYTDVDDLINKGIITVPGAKERINELLKDEIIVEETVEPVVEPVIEPVNDTTDTVIVKEDINETVEPVVEPVKTETSTKRSKKQNKTE